MHILRPETVAATAPPPLAEGLATDDYTKYLTDESKRRGQAACLAFPRTTAEVAAALRLGAARGDAVTVSGARTGITAGAVPDGGLLLSMERLNRVLGLRRANDGSVLIRCQAGVPLADLQRIVREGRCSDAGDWSPDAQATLRELRETRCFYPPDPTETSASIGGTIACNASGAHSFRYGPTRDYVQALRIVLADGRCLNIERGRCSTDSHGSFRFQQSDGRLTEAQVPLYARPTTKNSGGYYSGAGMDLIDLFIGSEGTLGIITEAELRLIPAPETSCTVVTFWPGETAALAFVHAVRERRDHLGLESVEYMGPHALCMLRQRRRQFGAASGVPACLPADAGCAVLVDIGTDAAVFEPILSDLAAVATDTGADPEQCWAAAERDEHERLRVFRHALPETVNTRIAEIRRTEPRITKLGTDMAVPDACLEQVLQLYRRALDGAGLEYVVFGHIGDNHLHVNILPRTTAEYARGKEFYDHFARQVIRMGGSPAGEHGIGKLKTDFLRLMIGDDGIRQMRAVKAVLDPQGLLGRGTLFPARAGSGTSAAAGIETGPQQEAE